MACANSVSAGTARFSGNSHAVGSIIAMCSAFQLQCNDLLEVLIQFFESFALRMGAGKAWYKSNINTRIRAFRMQAYGDERFEKLDSRVILRFRRNFLKITEDSSRAFEPDLVFQAPQREV
jgi:hypothetical protein